MKQLPLQHLANRIKFKLATPVATKLRELERTYQLGTDRLSELNRTDLRRIFEASQAKALAALKAAPDADAVAAIVEPTRGDVLAAASSQKTTLKNGLRELSREAFELAAPEVRRYVVAAREHVEELAAAERALAEAFALPPIDGPVIAALRAEIDRLAEIAERPWVGQIIRPASLTETFAPILA
jgi:hypothetical protein